MQVINKIEDKRPIGLFLLGRSLKTRFADHCGYVTNHHTDQATGAHFTQPGHSLANMKITLLEQVKTHDISYRKER